MEVKAVHVHDGGDGAYLQNDDQNYGLCSGDAGEHSVDNSRLADQGAVNDNPHHSHQFHQSGNSGRIFLAARSFS